MMSTSPWRAPDPNPGCNDLRSMARNLRSAEVDSRQSRHLGRGAFTPRPAAAPLARQGVTSQPLDHGSIRVRGCCAVESISGIVFQPRAGRLADDEIAADVEQDPSSGFLRTGRESRRQLARPAGAGHHDGIGIGFTAALMNSAAGRQRRDGSPCRCLLQRHRQDAITDICVSEPMTRTSTFIVHFLGAARRSLPGAAEQRVLQ
jgi:hypothetical protein